MKKTYTLPTEVNDDNKIASSGDSSANTMEKKMGIQNRSAYYL